MKYLYLLFLGSICQLKGPIFNTPLENSKKVILMVNSNKNIPISPIDQDVSTLYPKEDTTLASQMKNTILALVHECSNNYTNHTDYASSLNKLMRNIRKFALYKINNRLSGESKSGSVQFVFDPDTYIRNEFQRLYDEIGDILKESCHMFSPHSRKQIQDNNKSDDSDEEIFPANLGELQFSNYKSDENDEQLFPHDREQIQNNNKNDDSDEGIFPHSRKQIQKNTYEHDDNEHEYDSPITSRKLFPSHDNKPDYFKLKSRLDEYCKEILEKIGINLNESCKESVENIDINLNESCKESVENIDINLNKFPLLQRPFFKAREDTDSYNNLNKMNILIGFFKSLNFFLNESISLSSHLNSKREVFFELNSNSNYNNIRQSSCDNFWNINNIQNNYYERNCISDISNNTDKFIHGLNPEEERIQRRDYVKLKDKFGLYWNKAFEKITLCLKALDPLTDFSPGYDKFSADFPREAIRQSYLSDHKLYKIELLVNFVEGLNLFLDNF